MPSHSNETDPSRVSSETFSRRGFLGRLGRLGLAVGLGAATTGFTAERAIQLDADITALTVEREDIRPWITQYSDATDALGFYVSFSGTGLPVAAYMSSLIAPDVSKYNLCALAVNDGSHIRIEEVATQLVDRARSLRPDMDKVKFVFHGLSFGGIEAQLVANYIAEHYSDVAEVVGMMYESTPSGPEAVKKLVGKGLIGTGHAVGKAMILATNIWGIMVEQGRRDKDVQYDIMKCTNDTFASVIPEQAEIIGKGFPVPAKGEKSKKWYIGSFDETDLYVDTELSFSNIRRILGGALARVGLAGAGHAGGWVAMQYGTYRGAYEVALADIVPLFEA